MLGLDPEDEHAFWSGFFWAARFPGHPLFQRIKPYLLAMATDPSKRAGRLEILAGIILSGWANVDDATGQSPVTDDELRDTLRASDPSFRRQVIWQMEQWSRGDGGEWRNNALRLLLDVWPQELVVRDPKTSDALFSLAIETGNDFTAFVDAVTPLMTPLDKAAHCMLPLTLNNGNAQQLDAMALLKLVFAALPDNAADWPWGAEVVVNRLLATPGTAQDPRALQLRRRLADR
jgi:hypothetical protein